MANDNDLGIGEEHDGESATDDNDSDSNDPVETLIEGRAKRATAGNRLLNLLDKEADDDLELLFAEDDEDVEFEGADGDDASDVHLDTSSDEEDDQGQGDDDFEGERQLLKQDKVQRQKKRKAADTFFKPPAGRKRVKVDPTTATDAPTTPLPRQKKKSERLSWIPTPDEGPVRQSSRKQTVQNKEIIHARMKETEKRRLHQIAIMEAAAKRKEKAKPKVMTQADRLAEAERTEKLNSKSLNRWEEAEIKRSEEQRAKLAALQNRQMDTPFIRWWSGLAEWVNGKLYHVGNKAKIERIDGATGEDQVRANSMTGDGVDRSSDADARQTTEVQPARSTTESSHPGAPSIAAPSGNTYPQPISFAHPQGPAGFLEGIHYYASLPEPVQSQIQVPRQPSQIYADPVLLPPKALPPIIEYSTRNLVVLEDFDAVTVRDRETQRAILWKHTRYSKKVSKRPPETCVITSRPAKFRDPITGLPYFNAYAYKEIKKLQAGRYRWSDLLECYVGPAESAAQGVPERFRWRQNAPPSRRPEGTALA